jgi:hypothetical protein
MISAYRMAGVVRARLESQDGEIRSLQARVKILKAMNSKARATIAKNGKPEPLQVSGVDLGDGRPIRATLTFKDGWFEVRRWKSRRVWAVPLSDAVGVLARRGQVREINARRGVQP